MISHVLRMNRMLVLLSSSSHRRIHFISRVSRGSFFSCSFACSFNLRQSIMIHKYAYCWHFMMNNLAIASIFSTNVCFFSLFNFSYIHKSIQLMKNAIKTEFQFEFCQISINLVLYLLDHRNRFRNVDMNWFFINVIWNEIIPVENNKWIPNLESECIGNNSIA